MLYVSLFPYLPRYIGDVFIILKIEVSFVRIEKNFKSQGINCYASRVWLLGRHLFFSSNTRIFLATLQLAYLIFHGLLHPHYADNLYYLSNH